MFNFLNIQKSYAEFYFSAGASLSNNTNEIINNGKAELYPNFTVNSSQSNKELICENCYLWDTPGGIEFGNLYNTKTETNNFSVSSYKIKAPNTPSYTFAIGYIFLNNLRVEGEFRLSGMKKKLENLQTKINSNVNIQNIIECGAASSGPGINDSDIPRCNELFSTLNTEENFDKNFYDNLFNYIANNNGETPYISFANNINYYFMNVLYDIPVMKYFGLFSGVGAGWATIKLTSNSNTTINLNGSSYFYAYQYKLGTYYIPYKSQHLRLLFSFTSVNSIGNIKFNNFNVKPISQNSIDFSLMYIL
ncbi:MAG: hypothetical protein FWE18_01555 [Alphaproteobacteria bacterium]|nr:hypothetical protein [Alphaproteobacteria bacterium]